MSAGHIEAALTFWEDVCVLEHRLAQLEALKAGKPFTDEEHLKLLDFREHLQKREPWNDRYMYVGSNPLSYILRFMPLAIQAWMDTSKRVFLYPKDVTEQLRGEAKEDRPHTWGEFPWPFPAFALSFETPPILGTPPAGPYDTLLVLHADDAQKKMVIVQGLPAGLGQYEPLPRVLYDLLKNNLAETVEDLRRRFAERLPRNVRRLMKKPRRKRHPLELIGEKLRDASLEEMICELEVERLARMPLCMALSNGLHVLWTTDQERVQGPLFQLLWSLCERIARGGAISVGISDRATTHPGTGTDITSGADLFEVGAVSEVAGGEQARSEEENFSGKTVRPHPRRGHYRRPPGSAPDAGKTRWVSSTWVHREQAKTAGVLPVHQTLVRGEDKGS